ncbi:MAG: hypothetical protein ACRYGK_10445 [Janthinobacterium lividum]
MGKIRHEVWVFLSTLLLIVASNSAHAFQGPVAANVLADGHNGIPQKSEFDLDTLSPPRTPHEFLKLLQTISENFLLLDSNFKDDKTLLRLFGPCKLIDPDEAFQKVKGLGYRKIVPEDNSLLKTSLRASPMSLRFAKYSDQKPEKTGASFNFSTSSLGNPFSAEMIEETLGAPNEEWDPAARNNSAPSFENAGEYLRPERRSHAKGFVHLQYVHDDQKYTSRFDIELNQRGNVRRIFIHQREK